VPRFYPNVVTIAHDEAAIAEQRSTIDILLKSNLPGRWAVKDSFNALDLSRQGFDVLFEAAWIRNVMPVDGPSTVRTSRCSRAGAAIASSQAACCIAPTAS
jgi:hypothetical protein